MIEYRVGTWRAVNFQRFAFTWEVILNPALHCRACCDCVIIIVIDVHCCEWRSIAFFIVNSSKSFFLRDYYYLFYCQQYYQKISATPCVSQCRHFIHIDLGIRGTINWIRDSQALFISDPFRDTNKSPHMFALDDSIPLVIPPDKASCDGRNLISR